VLSREIHAQRIESTMKSRRLRTILDTMCLYNTSRNMQEEGLRWLLYTFDELNNDTTCEVPGYVLSQVVSYACEEVGNVAIQQLAVKVIGILALQEKNRR
jgi:hypothetical protein